MNGFQHIAFILLSKIQIPAQLYIHPDIGRHIEELCQAQSCAWGNSPAAIDKIIDTLVGNTNVISQLSLRQSHWIKKLLQQHFARIRGCAACRNANHSLSPAYDSNSFASQNKPWRRYYSIIGVVDRAGALYSEV